MSDYLPEELLTKILTYLPAKSLVQFASVCKSWYSLITSSNFITDHLNQTKISNNINNNHLILVRYFPGKPEKERYSLHFDNETFDTYQTLDFPFQTSELYFRVVGSCNGLLCLSDDYYGKMNTYILWNPTVRKSLNLPVPHFTYETHGPYEDAIGFGFDSKNNDYKVVRLVELLSAVDKSLRAEVFRLSTGTWETITATIKPSYSFDYDSDQVFLNGAVHWSGFKGSYCNVIIAFDMSNEVFRVIKLPTSYDGLYGQTQLPVAVCGEWLSFLDYSAGYPDSCGCSIWVMKEYGVVESWSKLYTFDLIGGLSQPLCFRINGEIIVAMKNRQLVSYDTYTQKIKYLGVRDSKKNQRPHYLNRFSFYVGAYVESLVLLGYRPWEEPVMQKRKRKRKDKGSKKNSDEAGAIEQL